MTVCLLLNLPVEKNKKICDVDRMMTDYKVETVNDSMCEFFVEFNGPPNSKFSSLI